MKKVKIVMLFVKHWHQKIVVTLHREKESLFMRFL